MTYRDGQGMLREDSCEGRAERDNMETNSEETKKPESLTWHKPEIVQLIVSLDTAVTSKNGSAIDGNTFDRPVGQPPD